MYKYKTIILNCNIISQYYCFIVFLISLGEQKRQK